MGFRSSGSDDYLKQVAGLLGASGVALGALGAHALHSKLVERGVLDSFRTAVLYQLFHASAIIGVAALSQNNPGNPSLKRVGQLLAIGTTMFSGSIYCLCLGVGPKTILGPTTPLGGLIMISGWTLLAFS